MFTNINDFIAWIESQKRTSPKVSLKKMRKYCEIIGNPQQNLRFIHIGGTNGKGSTVSYLKNILRYAGLNVGTFISPYVVCFNERIGYNEEYISDDELLHYGNLLLTYYPKFSEYGLENPTFFEALTLISFLFFASKKDIDVVILEVGLGGLLDSTNIIIPLVSVITNVSYDHMKILGNTLEEIALNKLGIAKTNVPLFTTYDERLANLFIDYTNEKKTPLYFVYPNDIQNIKVSLTETTYTYKDFNYSLQLLGHYQACNSVLSIEVAKYLKKYFPITHDNIVRGLKNTTWPGRIEVLRHEPLMIVDGAHNEGGIESLVSFIKDVNLDKKTRIIFAVSHDKEKDVMIKKLEEVASEMIFTEYHYKRSNRAEELYNLSTHPNKHYILEVKELIEELIDNNDQMMNVFCGSLYFASEVRKILLSQKG